MDIALQGSVINYPIGGNNIVGKLKFEVSPYPQPSGETTKQPTKPASGQVVANPKSGRVGMLERVYINETQYFDNVPELAWNFYIGGYQPAQKWLKDRKGRALNHEDIAHYQKIVGALTSTHALMQAIDVVFQAN